MQNYKIIINHKFHDHYYIFHILIDQLRLNLFILIY